MKATKFSNFDYTAIESLRVLPPLESRDKSISWARGSIRDKDFNELVVTGPRLPVLFPVRFNSVVFSIRGPGADDPSYAFECFLHKVLSHVEATVSSNVEKYKPGLKNAALIQVDRDFIRPSSYAIDMPNEFRVKLSVKRGHIDDAGEVVDKIDTVFVDEDGNSIDPDDVSSGSEIIPILKIGYYRNGNKFGLNATMVKGLVYPNTKKQRSVDFSQLEFDL
jgi:hypothetical protein